MKTQMTSTTQLNDSITMADEISRLTVGETTRVARYEADAESGNDGHVEFSWPLGIGKLNRLVRKTGLDRELFHVNYKNNTIYLDMPIEIADEVVG